MTQLMSYHVYTINSYSTLLQSKKIALRAKVKAKVHFKGPMSSMSSAVQQYHTNQHNARARLLHKQYKMASLAQQSEGLQKLQDHLTCPLCLELFENPKILPCHHVFCGACLQPLVDKARTQRGAFLCPECRSENEVSGEALKSAFSINALKDVFVKLQRERSDSVIHKQIVPSYAEDRPTNEMCSRHRFQSLDLYCQDCKAFVCRDCILADQQHAGHSFTYVSELAARNREDWKEKLVTLSALGKKLEEAAEEITQTKLEVDRQETKIVEKTEEDFEALFEVLKTEKRRVIALVHKVLEQKQIVLNAQQQTVLAFHSDVVQEEERLASITNSDQEVVKNWLSMKEKLKGLTDTIQQLTTIPLAVADVCGVSTVSPESLQELCAKSERILYLADNSKTQFLGKDLTTALTDIPTEFQLRLRDRNGDVCVTPQQVHAELKSLRSGMVQHATVTTSPQDHSNYTITYTLAVSGRYVLTVLVNGKNVPQNPFFLFAKKPPHQIRKPFAEISDLVAPGGLAIAGEKLYVVEHQGNKVTVFNSKLERVSSIGNLPGPSEIAIDDMSNVYICTVLDNRVHKFRADGELVKTIGGDRDNFNFPNGNTFHNQKLYVCDSDNHRIKIYDADMHRLSIVDKHSLKHIKFNFPSDIAIDNKGEIYVVDSKNHRIVVFTNNWQHLRTIGSEGKAPGKLLHPVSMYIVDDQIFVTEVENNRISVFSTSGKFLATFGEDYLQQPEGLTIDQDGFVYVSHNRRNVLVFC